MHDGARAGVNCERGCIHDRVRNANGFHTKRTDVERNFGFRESQVNSIKFEIVFNEATLDQPERVTWAPHGNIEFRE